MTKLLCIIIVASIFSYIVFAGNPPQENWRGAAKEIHQDVLDIKILLGANLPHNPVMTFLLPNGTIVTQAWNSTTSMRIPAEGDQVTINQSSYIVSYRRWFFADGVLQDIWMVLQ